MKNAIFSVRHFLLAALAFFSLATLSAWDESWVETGDCPEELAEYKDRYYEPNTSYLHDEAYWPTKNGDPFVDELMK